VSLLVLSHPDEDHSNFVPGVFDNSTKVENLAIGGQLSEYPDSVRLWLGQRIISGNSPQLFCFDRPSKAPANLPCSLGWTTGEFRILAVNHGGSDRNDDSTVLTFVHRDSQTSVLLPGDAQNALQSLETGALKSTILIAPHHGGHAKEQKTWYANVLKRIEPRILIFSAKNPKNYHPNSKVFDAVKESLANVIPVHDLSMFREKHLNGTCDRACYSTFDHEIIVVLIENSKTTLLFGESATEFNGEHRKRVSLFKWQRALS